MITAVARVEIGDNKQDGKEYDTDFGIDREYVVRPGRPVSDSVDQSVESTIHDNQILPLSTDRARDGSRTHTALSH